MILYTLEKYIDMWIYICMKGEETKSVIDDDVTTHVHTCE